MAGCQPASGVAGCLVAAAPNRKYSSGFIVIHARRLPAFGREVSVGVQAGGAGLLGGLLGFRDRPAGCLALLSNGDLFVNPNSGVAADICDALVNTCGIPPVAIPMGICPS